MTRARTTDNKAREMGRRTHQERMTKIKGDAAKRRMEAPRIAPQVIRRGVWTVQQSGQPIAMHWRKAKKLINAGKIELVSKGGS